MGDPAGLTSERPAQIGKQAGRHPLVEDKLPQVRRSFCRRCWEPLPIACDWCLRCGLEFVSQRTGTTTLVLALAAWACVSPLSVVCP